MRTRITGEQAAIETKKRWELAVIKNETIDRTKQSKTIEQVAVIKFDRTDKNQEIKQELKQLDWKIKIKKIVQSKIIKLWISNTTVKKGHLWEIEYLISH